MFSTKLEISVNTARQKTGYTYASPTRFLNSNRQDEYRQSKYEKKINHNFWKAKTNATYVQVTNKLFTK